MASPEQVWRVIDQRTVLEETAHEGRRILQELEHTDSLCVRVYGAVSDEYPAIEDAYEAVRSAITIAEREFGAATARLSMIGR